MRLITKRLTITIALLALSVLAANAEADQELTVGSGKNLTAKIASHDLTLIRIKNGRITAVAGAEGKLEVQKDVKNGQVYVQPTPGYSRKAVSIFLVDERGNTHKILLTPLPIPSESITIVRPEIAGESKKGERWETSQPYVAAIKNLIRLMARNKSPDGFSKTEVNQLIPLWKEAKLVLVNSYTGQNLTGEQYILQNVDKKPMRIEEHELYKPGVLAISIQDHYLKPGETTNVYVVADGAK